MNCPSAQLPLESVTNVTVQGRTKGLKFGRSPVHAWGLFAAQPIEPEDFIIEYVGERIRLKVGDARERRYNACGLGSSYLFRVDDEWVVDATKKVGYPSICKLLQVLRCIICLTGPQIPRLHHGTGCKVFGRDCLLATTDP